MKKNLKSRRSAPTFTSKSINHPLLSNHSNLRYVTVPKVTDPWIERIRNHNINILSSYVLREVIENHNVTWNDNGTLSYRPKRTVYFVPEMSVSDPKEDIVRVPNVPLLVSVLAFYVLRSIVIPETAGCKKNIFFNTSHVIILSRPVTIPTNLADTLSEAAKRNRCLIILLCKAITLFFSYQFNLYLLIRSVTVNILFVSFLLFYLYQGRYMTVIIVAAIDCNAKGRTSYGDESYEM